MNQVVLPACVFTGALITSQFLLARTLVRRTVNRPALAEQYLVLNEPLLETYSRYMRSIGMTLEAIAQTLTTRDIPTKTGKSARWTHQAIARIISRGR